MRSQNLGVALWAVFVLNTSVEAALFGRNLDGNPATYEAVYDQDRNITWLADANYAKTSNFDSDGRMHWASADAWAKSLNYYGYTGWRLPTTAQPDSTCSSQYNPGPPYGLLGYGKNCSGSEMGHLFYDELGGTAGQSILLSTDPDLALFFNIADGAYWSEEYVPNTAFGWAFGTADGHQDANNGKNNYDLWVWPVRPGDVAAAPEPATLALLGLSIAALGAARVYRQCF